MDILQENLSSNLPPSIPQIRNSRKRQLKALSANRYSKNDCGRPRDLHGDAEVCRAKFLKTLLEDLETIALLVILRDEAQPLDTLCFRLQHVDHEINRLLEHHLFRSEKTRKWFLSELKKIVESMKHAVKAWELSELAYESYEVERARMISGLPLGIGQKKLGLVWTTWCRNKANIPTEQQLIEASAKGIDLPVRIQVLPRGCRTILEHWRKETNDVVESILQVNDCNEVREREATLIDTYFVRLKDKRNGKLKRLMQPTEGGMYIAHRPMFMAEPVTSTANFLEKLVGMSHRTQGLRNFGIVLETFLDAPGMQVASKRWGLNIRNMGRNL